MNIIEKLEGTGRTDRGAMDVAAKPARKARERYYMHELRTVYPYGLNDRVGDEYTDNTHINVSSKFSSLLRKHIRRSRGLKRNGVSKLTPDEYCK